MYRQHLINRLMLEIENIEKELVKEYLKEKRNVLYMKDLQMLLTEHEHQLIELNKEVLYNEHI